MKSTVSCRVDMHMWAYVCLRFDRLRRFSPGSTWSWWSNLASQLYFPSCLSPANIYNPETVGALWIKLEVAFLIALINYCSSNKTLMALWFLKILIYIQTLILSSLRSEMLPFVSERPESYKEKKSPRLFLFALPGNWPVAPVKLFYFFSIAGGRWHLTLYECDNLPCCPH